MLTCKLTAGFAVVFGLRIAVFTPRDLLHVRPHTFLTYLHLHIYVSTWSAWMFLPAEIPFFTVDYLGIKFSPAPSQSHRRFPDLADNREEYQDNIRATVEKEEQQKSENQRQKKVSRSRQEASGGIHPYRNVEVGCKLEQSRCLKR